MLFIFRASEADILLVVVDSSDTSVLYRIQQQEITVEEFIADHLCRLGLTSDCEHEAGLPNPEILNSVYSNNLFYLYIYNITPVNSAFGGARSNAKLEPVSCLYKGSSYGCRYNGHSAGHNVCVGPDKYA